MAEKKDREKLKACPFCGGEAYLDDSNEEHADGAFMSCIRCSDCGAESEWFYTKEEAIKAWNTRPSPHEGLSKKTIRVLHKMHRDFFLIDNPLKLTESWREEFSNAIKEAIASAQPKQREWISVSKKLPKGVWSKNHLHLSEEVLINNSCSIGIGYYNRTTKHWYVEEPAKEEWIDKVTHWQPLPEPPK